MSALCQKQTHASQQSAQLLDHLVGELLHMQRHIEAERFGGLEVDQQLEPRGLCTPS